MIAIVAFEPQHAASIVLQAPQRGEAESLGFRAGDAADLGPAFSAVEQDEAGHVVRVLCCAGLAENAPDHATAWALIAEGVGGAGMVAITRAIRRVLDAADYKRVDMLVRESFGRAHDFAKLLGFERDFALYVRTPAPLFERQN
jgi:hypothetical protein